MNWLGQIVQANITPNDAILDLGCGIQQAFPEGLICKSMLGVDIWDIYLNNIKNRINTVRISMNETDRFMDKSFDVVICLDVVEHLDHELALKIIDECKRIARRKAIIYTPAEFKDNKEAIINSWELGENPHQEHKCLLSKPDFHLRGYHVDKPSGDDLLAIWQ